MSGKKLELLSIAQFADYQRSQSAGLLLWQWPLLCVMAIAPDISKNLTLVNYGPEKREKNLDSKTNNPTGPGAEMKARAREAACNALFGEVESVQIFITPRELLSSAARYNIDRHTEALAAFAAKEVARATAKVVCSFCGTVTEFDRTQEHGQIDAILAHINKCEKSPVLRLMDALQKIDELEAELLRATGKHQALVNSATEFAWQPLSEDWRPSRTKLRKALEDLKK